MSLHASEERRWQPQTLVEAALRVLTTADPVEKARLGDAAAKRWLDGAIFKPYDASIRLPFPTDPPGFPTSNSSLLSSCPSLGKLEAFKAGRRSSTALCALRAGPSICLGTKAGTSLCLLPVSRSWVLITEHSRLMMASGILPLQPQGVYWLVLPLSIAFMRQWRR